MALDLGVAVVFGFFWGWHTVAIRQELRAIRRELANIADQTDPLSMALLSHDRRERGRRLRERMNNVGTLPNRGSGRADPDAPEGKPEC